MSLVPKEILLSHLQRAEGAKEVTLPIDFFRDLLYQAMPRTWVELTLDEIGWCFDDAEDDKVLAVINIERMLKEKNT